MPEIEDDVVYDVTIVIPTYHEPGIGTLLREIDQVCARAHLRAEVLVIDDTPDDTVVTAVQDTPTVCVVEVIHRPTQEGAWGGLSGAVVDGMGLAHAPIVVVMDGDGQHPPDVIPTMYQLLEHNELFAQDMIIASRYTDGGSHDGLDKGWRRFVSAGCTLLARMMFPRRIGMKTSDPMTGFFAVYTEELNIDKVRAYTSGFKILLTILATHPYLDVVEVPFVFRKRYDGESKAGLKNGTTSAAAGASPGGFVRRRRRFTLFALVGLTGVFVNAAVMWGLHAVGVQYLIAMVVATQTAIGWNLLLSEWFVFHDKKHHTEFSSRLVQYYVVNNLDLLLRVPLMVLLVEVIGMRPSPANLILIAAASCVKYVVINRFIYRPHPVAPRRSRVRRSSRMTESV